jgi:hypothetical protein
MKRIILLVGIVLMTLNVFSQTENDTTRYKYELDIKVLSGDTSDVSNFEFDYFRFLVQQRYGKQPIDQMNDRCYLRTNTKDFHNRMGVLLKDTMMVNIKVRILVTNLTLDEKYMCWYKAGKKMIHPIVEQYDPFSAADWQNVE